MINNPELILCGTSYRDNDMFALSSYQKEIIADILPDTTDDVLSPLRLLAQNIRKLNRLF